MVPSSCLETYRDARVAVLGASGSIGRWVARLLCEQGARVQLIVRNRSTAQAIFRAYGIRGNIFDLDISDFEALYRVLHECKPSITFNLAGYGVDRSENSEAEAYRTNSDLVMALCEAIAGLREPKWVGQDIVHVGSALEYGALDGDLAENSIPNPTTVYGKSKLAGTIFLSRCSKAFGIRGLTARVFTVYGPGEHDGRLLPSLLETAKTGMPLELTAGVQNRDFTYVGDVAEGLLRLGLIRSKPGEIINLATGKLISVRSFVETAAGILGIPLELLLFGSIPTRPDEMNHSEVTIARLQQHTGWFPATGIEKGIRRTASFEKGEDNGESRDG
jgi:UDP-glucose 4-epimerase